jgi:hypothetical protein
MTDKEKFDTTDKSIHLNLSKFAVEDFFKVSTILSEQKDRENNKENKMTHQSPER